LLGTQPTSRTFCTWYTSNAAFMTYLANSGSKSGQRKPRTQGPSSLARSAIMARALVPALCARPRIASSSREGKHGQHDTGRLCSHAAWSPASSSREGKCYSKDQHTHGRCDIIREVLGHEALPGGAAGVGSQARRVRPAWCQHAVRHAARHAVSMQSGTQPGSQPCTNLVCPAWRWHAPHDPRSTNGEMPSRRVRLLRRAYAPCGPQHAW